MSNNYFQFKQFLVKQDKSAMRVSTDACIQGAWTPIEPVVKHVLDIGTGTGLLSLMLAQRNDSIIIDAIELDEHAADEAKENVAASPFHDRINITQADIREVTLDKQYDLIICNPPFFRDSLLGPTTNRNTARHALSFSYADMFGVLEKFLANGGYASILLPPVEHEQWEKLLQTNGWNVFHRLHVRPRSSNDVNRVVGLCSPNKIGNTIEEVVIYEDKDYTQQFSALLRPYYLKL
ncbi:tRNA1(Val) (adenine(37)-N6)-methyltransferase [Polluticoccus soli]|uniref:tRNA1(Val) (adenine(37)-N6)-methyltransferase n=1 Tax=Polluticoccus soli TaxID=3034150 RepID=UPI0023E23CFF|nr:methyltransferase [Flavipsychrobacter sp. JY13-12]